MSSRKSTSKLVDTFIHMKPTGTPSSPAFEKIAFPISFVIYKWLARLVKIKHKLLTILVHPFPVEIGEANIKYICWDNQKAKESIYAKKNETQILTISTSILLQWRLRSILMLGSLKAKRKYMWREGHNIFIHFHIHLLQQSFEKQTITICLTKSSSTCWPGGHRYGLNRTAR